MKKNIEYVLMSYWLLLIVNAYIFEFSIVFLNSASLLFAGSESTYAVLYIIVLKMIGMSFSNDYDELDNSEKYQRLVVLSSVIWMPIIHAFSSYQASFLNMLAFSFVYLSIKIISMRGASSDIKTVTPIIFIVIFIFNINSINLTPFISYMAFGLLMFILEVTVFRLKMFNGVSKKERKKVEAAKEEKLNKSSSASEILNRNSDKIEQYKQELLSQIRESDK